MKAPVISEKYLVPAVIITAVLTLGCAVFNAFILPGWIYMGLIEIILVTLMLILFARNWSPETVRYGILVYAVATGIQVIGQRYPALMGEFHFGSALGPFANNVGLLIGLPWFISIMLSVQVAHKITGKLYASALLGAILSMVPALFMIYNGESLDFFYWTDIVPPIRTFVIWFAAIFILHFSAGQMQIDFSNPAGKPLYLTWFGFHLLLFCLRLAV